MSVVWMAVVAGLTAFEKLIPFHRARTYTAAAILLVLGVLVMAVPNTIPRGSRSPGAARCLR